MSFECNIPFGKEIFIQLLYRCFEIRSRLAERLENFLNFRSGEVQKYCPFAFILEDSQLGHGAFP
jgi:hypothetical protein